MAYTPELRELIKKVEATRPARLERARRGENYPALTMDEREEVLSKFHPDYQKDAKRIVRVGPNKGDSLQDQVVGLLESKSIIRPDKVNLNAVNHETLKKKYVEREREPDLSTLGAWKPKETQYL